MDFHSLCFGLHGTTAIALPVKDGVLLGVDSRASNEKVFQRKLKIYDINLKAYDISHGTLGIMLGDRNDCILMKRELMSKCANMDSVSDVFVAAEEYVSSFRGKKKKFGTIICGSNAQGSQPQLFSVYVNGDDVVTTRDLKFLSLGTCRSYATQKAVKLMGSGNVDEFQYNLSVQIAADFVLRCLFESTHSDISTGGLLRVYLVSKGKWTCLHNCDILDAYMNYYESYEEDRTLYLIVNCDKSGNMSTKDLLEFFRPYGQISFAHRVAKVCVEKNFRFYFHRLVCNSSQDASNINSYVMQAPQYQLKAATLSPSIMKIVDAFPHRLAVNVKQETIYVYVNRASRTLLDLICTSRNYQEDIYEDFFITPLIFYFQQFL